MQSNIITLKPTKNSKQFFSTAQTKVKITDPQTGEEREKVTGQYKGERFPRSKQVIRPQFSINNSRWEIQIEEDELQEFVKKFKLKYTKGPLKGQFITEAELTDYGDAFFNHPELALIANEGILKLNLDNFREKFFYLCLLGSSQVSANTGESQYVSSMVRYLLVDPKSDKKIERRGLDKTREAYKLLEALTYDKKLKVAFAMALHVNSNMDPEDLDYELIRAIEDTKTVIDDMNRKKVDLFIDICRLPADELYVKNLRGEARKYGIIRKAKGKGFTLYGVSIGNTEEDVEAFLGNEENEATVNRLEADLAEKRK